ncbi:MAG: rsmB [Rhodocyclaceae bacterium]|nr:rsmB [Rhodocyclaceae bacterium]
MSQSLPSDSLAFALLNAAQVVTAVVGGQSLADGLLAKVPAVARPAAQDLVYGSLRQYGRGGFFLSHLLEKPLGQPVVNALLLVALYRLESRPDSPHTVVDQAVRAAGQVAGGRFKGLVNGVLRNFLRRQEELLAAVAADEVASLTHPEWWLRRLKTAYPEDWPAIVAAGNTPPPMALRVNRRRAGRDDYASGLPDVGIEAWPRGEDGLLLARPVPVDRLPGFAEGLVSVQDLGAQRAAALLDPAPGSRVLDACAAPGGKTAHILERADVDLLALDLKPARCRRIQDNLDRLGLQAQVRAADASRIDQWWDGNPFDAVLADVPCTASGVVRRHPDAKWLRREADIAGFARAQAALLDALWRVVKPGGKLLYATCSVFPEEDAGQVDGFVARQPEALRCHEELLLPDAEHDGFYYCLLEKPL